MTRVTCHLVASETPLQSKEIEKEDIRKATWKKGFKLPWREAGPPNHHEDQVDSDQ